MTPDIDPNKPIYLSSFGNSLLRQFEQNSERASVDKAIEAHQRALSLLPSNHAAKPSCLNNLAIVYLKRFLTYTEREDIDNAIETLCEAVQSTPQDHPNQSSHLLNLGNALRLRYDEYKGTEDIHKAISNFADAARSSSGSPSMRLSAAVEWSKYASMSGSSPLEAFKCAVDLLPEVAWMGMSVFDRQAALYEFGNVVREAAGAAIAAGEYTTAVEWLEEGRTVVWAQLLKLRTPLDQLREKLPELVERLEQVSKGLDSHQNSSIYDEEAVQRRHSLTSEWEALVAKVREHPEFKNFLRPRKFSELATAASAGPIVIINVCHSRCDALIVTNEKNEPLYVPLPELSVEKITSMRSDLIKCIEESGKPVPTVAQDVSLRFAKLLSSLWNLVTKPILDAMFLSVSPLSSEGCPPVLTEILDYKSQAQAKFLGFGISTHSSAHLVVPYRTPKPTSHTRSWDLRSEEKEKYRLCIRFRDLLLHSQSQCFDQRAWSFERRTGEPRYHGSRTSWNSPCTHRQCL
jgi:tetratricopeptide (TPR) repeat protein